MKNTIYSYIEGNVAKKESVTAIAFKDQNISFGEFLESVNGIYNKIVELNIKNEAIIIALERCPLMIASMVAVVESRNYYVPVDFMYPRERIDYIVNHCKAGVIITDAAHKNQFTNSTVIDIAEIENAKTKCREIEFTKERLAYCLYTSGSTGNPKGVLVNEPALINFVEGIDRIIPYSLSKSILCATTQCFDIFFLENIMALMLGVTVVLTEAKDGANPKKLRQLINDHGIDMIQMTPSRVNLVKEFDEDLKSFERVKIIMIGGEVFPEALLKELQSKTKARIFNMYGPTETTIWSSVGELTDSKEVHVGKPILETTFCIIDSQNELVKNGETGELCIGGLGLSNGYLHDESKTKERFINVNGELVYKTGDNARYDAENGNYYVCGRIDNQIKINGFRVELEEIENVGTKTEGVMQCVVHPVKKDGVVEKLVLFYVANRKLTGKEIEETMREYLPPYMIPTEYIQVDNFQYTPNGKIDRKQLVYEENIQSSDTQSSGDEDWDTVRALLQELAGVPISVSGDEELKSIMNSLQFAKLLVEVENRFDVEFDDEYLNMDRYESVYSIYTTMKELI